MRPTFVVNAFISASTLALLAFAPPVCATEQAIYSFTCYPAGSQPYAGLASNSAGDLFGATLQGGTNKAGLAFELTPPNAGGAAWTPDNLYSFGTGSRKPNAAYVGTVMSSLLATTSGSLLGTAFSSNGKTCDGAGCGAVFALTPGSSATVPWAQQILHAFKSTDGANPAASLVVDHAGHIYGTTENGGPSGAGTVYQLVAPKTSGKPWQVNTLFGFANRTDGGFPMAPVIADRAGALYGTAAYSGDFGAGTVFKLTPPATKDAGWTQTVLYTFGLSGAPDDGDMPESGLVMDTAGALYGTAVQGGLYSEGVVFKLTPPAAGQSGWTYATLYSFQGGADGALPTGALVLDHAGNLYGTTQGTGSNGDFGTVFEVSPPTSGSAAWTNTVLHLFTGQPDGAFPASALIAGPAGALYGTTLGGGQDNCGEVFSVAP